MKESYVKTESETTITNTHLGLILAASLLSTNRRTHIDLEMTIIAMAIGNIITAALYVVSMAVNL